MSRIVEEYVRSLYIILESGDINNDVYNNALSIQILIKRLYGEGLISNEEVTIIDKIASGYSFAEVGDMMNVTRKRVAKKFKKTCGILGYILGGKFTDVGFAYDVASKRLLSEKAIAKLDKFLARKR